MHILGGASKESDVSAPGLLLCFETRTWILVAVSDTAQHKAHKASRPAYVFAHRSHIAHCGAGMDDNIAQPGLQT